MDIKEIAQKTWDIWAEYYNGSENDHEERLKEIENLINQFIQKKANDADTGDDKCHIQNVRLMLPEEICKLNGHAMYSVYQLSNTANGHTSHFGLNKCSRCNHEEPWQFDM